MITSPRSLAFLAGVILVGYCGASCVGTVEAGQGDDERAEKIAARARGLQTGGIYGAASRAWEKLLERHPADPRVPEATFSLGCCYFELGRYKAAVGVLSTCAASFPAYGKAPELHYALARAHKQLADREKGGYQKAAEAFQRVVDADPSGDYAANALLWRTTCLANDRRFKEARDCVDTLLEKWKDQPEAAMGWYWRGAIEMQLGNDRLSAQAYEKALADWPDHTAAPDAHFDLGTFLLAEKKPLEAAKHFRMAAESEDLAYRDLAQLQYGKALQAAGNDAGAYRAYRALETTFPMSELRPKANAAAEELLRTSEAARKAASDLATPATK